VKLILEVFNRGTGIQGGKGKIWIPASAGMTGLVDNGTIPYFKQLN